MGWWRVAENGHLIGDQPLDTLADAVTETLRLYVEGHGRRPTREEWQTLLELVLGETPVLDHGEVKKVVLE